MQSNWTQLCIINQIDQNWPKSIISYHNQPKLIDLNQIDHSKSNQLQSIKFDKSKEFHIPTSSRDQSGV